MTAVIGRIVTRVEFGIRYAHNDQIGTIAVETAERFIEQGETSGKLGTLMRRESGPGFTGEWKPQDGGTIRVCIDADCPSCGWAERWMDMPGDGCLPVFGCNKCEYRSGERDR